MTVIRLADGGVFLHSPVHADAATRAAVDAIGPVRAIVAPNRVHHLFAGEWKAAYPQARAARRAGARREAHATSPSTRMLGDGPGPSCAASLDQLVIRGAPVHVRRSRSCTARAARCCSPTSPSIRRRESARGARIWMRLTTRRARSARTRIVRSPSATARAFRASLDRVLAWDFDRVTVTHGELLETAAARRCAGPTRGMPVPGLAGAHARA